MGCGCSKNKLNEKDLNISEENKNNINQEANLVNENNDNKEEKNTTLLETKNQESILDLKNDENKYLENNQYNKRVFELINKIRLNPPEYSKTILDNIKYISFEERQELNKNSGMEELKEIIVFKKKVKVQLFRGEECFKEAAQILINTPPMDVLKFKKDIVIPLPINEKDIKNSDFIKNKVNEIISHTNIHTYYKDYIKNPEIAVLLMIVGDNEVYKTKKRKAILNKDYKYIGIDSKFIGKNFISHFSFSK